MTDDLSPVLWIHDILEWIRIRGSMPLTYDPDPDPAFFVIDLQDANKKQCLFKHFFCFLLFEKVHIHNFPKIKSKKESQNSRIKVRFSYYLFLHDYRRIWIHTSD